METTSVMELSGGNLEFPTRLIAAKYTGEEIGYIGEDIELDMSIGKENDFEIQINANEWKREKLGFGNRVFIPGTEYGGIINCATSNTSTSKVILGGETWRGMLGFKIVEPPEGESHLILSGELNDVIRELVGERFGSLFVVPHINTGIELTDWQVDRYVTLYDAITKITNTHEYRLEIAYKEPDELTYGYVEMQAVPVKDYSDELEYSQDGKVNFSIEDYRGGINHLICIGEGQNEERTVIHLYVQEDGSIGETQYYKGLDEREAVYNYTSADSDKLKEDGTARLKELQNYKKNEVTAEDMDLELGDIIGGYDQITGTYAKKPVTEKILKISEGKATIDYTIEGDE